MNLGFYYFYGIFYRYFKTRWAMSSLMIFSSKPYSGLIPCARLYTRSSVFLLLHHPTNSIR